MIEVSPLTLLLYFVAGIVFTILAAHLHVRKLRSKAKRNQHRWVKVEDLTWHCDFDYTFDEEMNGTQLGITTAMVMRDILEKKPFPPFTIVPGDYTVKLTVNAHFIKRESGDAGT